MKNAAALLVGAGLALGFSPSFISGAEPANGGDHPLVLAPVAVNPVDGAKPSAFVAPAADRMRDEIARVLSEGPTPESWDLLTRDVSKYRTALKQQQDALNPLFRQWGRESPETAMRYLTTNPAIFVGLKRGLMDEILAGRAVNAPEDAWEAARKTHRDGTSMMPFVAIVRSLAETKRYELAAAFLANADRTEIDGTAMSVGINDLAAAWSVADPKAASQWLQTLSGVDLINAKLGLAKAAVKKDAGDVRAQLGKMDPKDASLAAMALANAPGISPADAARLLAAAPNAEDGRYADAIMMHFMQLNMAAFLQEPSAGYAEKEVAADLLSKLPVERRPKLVEGYVLFVGQKSPADAVWVAKKFLTPDETLAAFGKLLSRGRSSPQEAESLMKVLESVDPELRKKLGP